MNDKICRNGGKCDVNVTTTDPATGEKLAFEEQKYRVFCRCPEYFYGTRCGRSEYVTQWGILNLIRRVEDGLTRGPWCVT